MKRKWSFVLGLIVVLTFTISSTCFATYYFSMRFVDSNSFTYIVSDEKKTSQAIGYIYIREIYKSDGSESDYNRIKVRAGSEGKGTTILKERSYNIPIPDSYKIGDSVPLYAKGNNPALDCLISGEWSAL